jgi:hypothetical protein
MLAPPISLARDLRYMAIRAGAAGGPCIAQRSRGGHGSGGAAKLAAALSGGRARSARSLPNRRGLHVRVL